MLEDKELASSCGCFVLLVLALFLFPFAREVYGFTYAILAIVFACLFVVLLITLGAKMWLKIMHKLGWWRKDPPASS